MPMTNSIRVTEERIRNILFMVKTPRGLMAKTFYYYTPGFRGKTPENKEAHPPSAIQGILEWFT